MMITIEQVIILHDLLIRETGGILGIRDFKLLDSAVQSPNHSFEGVDLYKTIESKASRLCISLIKNHPFIDGNKRTGILAMEYFLEINNTSIKCSDKELINIGLSIANNKLSFDNLIDWIKNHTK
jgi:death-on-curing protein